MQKMSFAVLVTLFSLTYLNASEIDSKNNAIAQATTDSQKIIGGDISIITRLQEKLPIFKRLDRILFQFDQENPVVKRYQDLHTKKETALNKLKDSLGAMLSKCYIMVDNPRFRKPPYIYPNQNDRTIVKKICNFPMPRPIYNELYGLVSNATGRTPTGTAFYSTDLQQLPQSFQSIRKNMQDFMTTIAHAMNNVELDGTGASRAMHEMIANTTAMARKDGFTDRAMQSLGKHIHNLKQLHTAITKYKSTYEFLSAQELEIITQWIASCDDYVKGIQESLRDAATDMIYSVNYLTELAKRVIDAVNEERERQNRARKDPFNKAFWTDTVGGGFKSLGSEFEKIGKASGDFFKEQVWEEGIKKYVVDPINEKLIQPVIDGARSIRDTIRSLAETLEGTPTKIRTDASDLIGGNGKKSMADQLGDGVVEIKQQIKTIQATIEDTKKQKQGVIDQKLDKKGIKEMRELHDILVGTAQNPGVFDAVIAALDELAGPTGALLELQKALEDSTKIAQEGITSIQANITETENAINGKGLPGNLRAIAKVFDF